MTFADYRPQNAGFFTSWYSQIFPLALPRANNKQANLNAIQAYLGDIRVNQNAIFGEM